MCGIAGVLHFDGQPVRPALIEEMTRAQAHRGPDDFGHVLFDHDGTAHEWRDAAPAVSGRLALGNRRLRIIDLSPAGHQPMSTRDGALWLTFNGELYNYVELRAELAAFGRDFRSHTDTEVVLQAYEQWGPDAFSRFNGMWALAIADLRDRSLTLCRDRAGVKPLYVHRAPDRLVFASEIKAILRHPGVERAPNLRSVYNYVARHYRWVDGGRDSFFAGIEHFPPGHYGRIALDGVMHERAFWQLTPTDEPSATSDADALGRFRDLFEDSVRLRLRSDVPVACLLSGGLDSSSVTCAAARISSASVTTFSARYAESSFDEGPYIQATVDHVGADARFIYPEAADLIETLGEMIAAHDEPVCTVTWYAHWLLMKQVSGMGFPVLLNGHAGDELFGGYWSHYMYNLYDLDGEDPPAFRREIDAWRQHHGRDPAEYDRMKRQIDAIRAGSATEADVETQYASVVAIDDAAISIPPPRPNPYSKRGALTAKLYSEFTYETVPATLRPEDRNSMAFAIESRSPFLDYRLIEFAFALPNRMKIRDGLGKWIIREGMRGVLPEAVRMRPDKQGWNAPTVHWFRGESKDSIRAILGSDAMRRRGIMNQREVLRRFDEHVDGRADHALAIWQWVNVELWMAQALDSSSDA